MMDSIVSLPYRIVEWLSAQSDMDDIKFFVEYPPVNKAVPLRRTIVAVGMDSIDIVDKFVANDDGVLERRNTAVLQKSRLISVSVFRSRWAVRPAMIFLPELRMR